VLIPENWKSGLPQNNIHLEELRISIAKAGTALCGI
jgi:hypothetical protein